MRTSRRTENRYVCVSRVREFLHLPFSDGLTRVCLNSLRHRVHPTPAAAGIHRRIAGGNGARDIAPQVRPAATASALVPPSDSVARRTFAIISHPDAGKTTLTEKLLLYGGAVQVGGRMESCRGVE